MVRKQDSQPSTAKAYRHVALGFQFAGGVLLFTGAGFALDRWLGLVPLLTVAGALVGATLSILNVVWRLRAEEKDRRDR